MAAPVVQASRTTWDTGGSGAGLFAVDLPTGVASGELLIAWVSGRNLTWGAAPSGWTKITATAAAGSYSAAAYWREATGAETLVEFPFTGTGNDPLLGIAVRITGHRPGDPFDGQAANSGDASSQPAPSLTPSGLERLSLVLGSWQHDSTPTPAPPSGYTQHATLTRLNGHVAAASLALSSASATGALPYQLTGTSKRIFGHLHLLIKPFDATAIVPPVIAPTTELFPPRASLGTQYVAFLFFADTVVLTQGMRRGDTLATLPEWASSGGGGLDYRNLGSFNIEVVYRPSSLIVGTRAFEPSAAPGPVSIEGPHIAGTVVPDPGIGAADVTVEMDHIASTTMWGPLVHDGQAIGLDSTTPLPARGEVFAPRITPGPVYAVLPEAVAETLLFEPGPFHLSLTVGLAGPGTVVFRPGLGVEIAGPFISSTLVPQQRIGQYAILAEPDEVIWGASGGYSARIDFLDSSGDVVASTADPNSRIVLVSGTVSEDTTSAVTRECSLRFLFENTPDGRRHPLLPAKPGDPLDPRSDSQLAIYAGPVRPSGKPALVKLGVFHITAASPISSATGDALSVRGLSGEHHLSSTPFYRVFQVTSGTPITRAIERMVLEAMPHAKVFVESSSLTTPEFSFAESDNRMSRIRELANSIGMTARFDRNGRFRIEHQPEYGDAAFSTPRWVFTEGKNAVMRDVGRDLDDEDLYNGVIVVGEPRDTNSPPVRAELWDTNPASPMYYNPNAPGTSKRGPRPKKIVSPLVYTVAQAQALASYVLGQILTWPDKITVKVAANPHLEAGDLARIVRTTMGVDGLYEIQQVDHDLLGGESTAVCSARTF